jgi:hypothetical protein
MLVLAIRSALSAGKVLPMTVNKDFDKSIAVAHSIVPAAKTATATGSAVDLVGFDAAVAVISSGVITDGTHTPKLQESDASGSGFADVAAGDLSGAFTAMATGGGNGGSAIQEVGYLGAKRYIKVVVTVSGATTGGVYGASIVKGKPRTLPQ